jgi:hypothetical protein
MDNSAQANTQGRQAGISNVNGVSTKPTAARLKNENALVNKWPPSQHSMVNGSNSQDLCRSSDDNPGILRFSDDDVSRLGTVSNSKPAMTKTLKNQTMIIFLNLLMIIIIIYDLGKIK